MLFFVLMFVLGFVIFGIGFNSLIGGYAKRNGTMTTAYVELGVGLFVATMFGTGLFRAMRQQEAERRRSTVRRNRRGTGGRGKSGRETSSRGQSSDSSVDS
jgi:uncharacterized membrane protein (DUF485 family)